ncbi:MAG TPA: TolC family protein, partial [Telluria sp.]|nr:TolC family protein [Telluria sp.]
MIDARGALRRSAGAAAVLLALCGSAGAVTLQQAYQAALKNDPTFRMNFYEKEYGKENEIIGRSYILPSVSASYSAARNIADQTGPGMFGIGTSTTHPRYISRSSVVQMRQPLLNMEGIA